VTDNLKRSLEAGLTVLACRRIGGPAPLLSHWIWAPSAWATDTVSRQTMIRDGFMTKNGGGGNGSGVRKELEVAVWVLACH
jgi:hypothetical protein